MGVQNFSGGGFYGKVGTVVGYRRNGEFIIKKHTIPFNPNTDKQKVVRGKFREWSKLASFSNNLNRGTPCISLVSIGNSAARCGIAASNQKAGMTGLSQIPLFDSEHYPPFIANEIYFVRYSGNTVILFVSGVLPSEPRKISIVVDFADSPAEFCEWAITSGEFEPTSTGGRIVAQNPFGEVWSENSKIIFISNDDKDHDSQNFWLPERPLGLKLPETRTFDSSIISFSRSSRTFTIVFAENYFSGVQNFDSVSVHCVSEGVWGDFLLENPSFQNSDGYFSLTFSAPGADEASLWAFPVNSEITFSGFTISSDELILTAPLAPISLIDSSDLVRNLPDEICQDPNVQEDGDFYLNFSLNLPVSLFDVPPSEDVIYIYQEPISNIASEWGFQVNSKFYEFDFVQFLQGSFAWSIEDVYTNSEGKRIIKLFQDKNLSVSDPDEWEFETSIGQKCIWKKLNGGILSVSKNSVTYKIRIIIPENLSLFII